MFTWYPAFTGDKPPKAVIVREVCNTTASATAGGTSPVATASATNGLGHPAVDDPNNNTATYQHQGQNSSGTRYKVYYPGADGTVVLTCTPHASASASKTGYSGNITASLKVAYTAYVTPVSLDMVGATASGGALNVLTGQQITATLSGCYLQIKLPESTGLYPGTPIWTVGGDVFKNYPYDQPVCHVANLMNDDIYGTTPVSFYTKKGENISVHFEADLLVPSDALPQPTIHLSIDSEAVSSMKPTIVWETHPSFENIGGFFDTFSEEFGVKSYYHPVSITVPAPFSGGQGCVAQLVETTRSVERVPLNGKTSVYTGKIPITSNGTTVWINPPKGLDKAFPYPFSYQIDSEGRKTPIDIWNVSYDAASGDTPKQPFKLVVNDGGGNDWFKSSASDKFDTYVMFRPPAVGSQATTWIPINILQWSWKASVKRTGTQWSIVDEPPIGPGVWNMPASTTPINDPPEWDIVVAGQAFKP